MDIHLKGGASPGRALLSAFALLVAIFLLAPTVVVIVMSLSSGFLLTFPPPGFDFKWYVNFFMTQKWTDSAWNSVQIGLIATSLSVLLGTLAAFGLATARPRGTRFITGVVLSPLVAPVVITAIGMFITFRNMGLDAFFGIIAAHSVLGLPYVFITVSAGLRDIDPDLELAALSLGASPSRSFMRITLPLVFPSVMIGAIFAFVTSWDEVVIAQFLATPTMRTLPVTMWEEARESVDPTIAAASSLLTVVMLLLLLSFLLLQRAQPKRAAAGEREA